MSAQLPLWFGRERGVDLSGLVDWEDEDGADDGPGLLDGAGAAVLGFAVPLAIIALVLAAGQLPMYAMVMLGIAGAAWLTGGLAAGWLVTFSEDAPGWARTAVAVMTQMGKVVALMFIIASVVILLALVAGLILAMASDRR